MPFHTHPASAQPSWNCLEPALKQQLERQLEFEDSFSAAVISKRPDLREISNLVASATKEGFRVRLSRIFWLWKNDQSRFADSGSFWNFDWSEEDAQAWRRADKSHAISDDLKVSLTRQVNEHPDILDYDSFVSENRQDKLFFELKQTFGQGNRLGRNRIADCF